MKNLLQSKHFCILPFVSSRIQQGSPVPCCINHEVIFGELSDNTIDEIYDPNNPILKNFRKQLINGPELPPSCHRCKHQEDHNMRSYRQDNNLRYGDVLDTLDFDESGYLREFKVYFYDGIGFSNLCNLKCRMCPSILSTTNREEEIRYNLPLKKMSKVQTEYVQEYLKTHDMPKVLMETFTDLNQFYTFFNNSIDTVRDIKFEGGEPLMMEEHFKVLESLIKLGKTDVNIKYATNLTRLHFKDYDILELWKQFKNVDISVSLDGMYDRNNYIRNPSKFQDVVDNINRVKSEAPHVNMGINTTMQILTSYTASDLNIFCIENNLPQNFIFLHNPSHMSMTVLPKHVKEKVVRHWERHIEQYPQYTNEIRGFLNMMNSQDNSHEINEFLDFMKERDTVRGEDLFYTFPELLDIK